MDSDQGKIFVGGISWETTEEKLKEHFNGFGTVLEAVIIKEKTTGRARGFGFVAFADPEVVDKVLAEKHTIDGRTVEVKKSVPRDEQQNLPKSNGAGTNSGNNTRTKKIFVGGLASSVTEEEFRNYFSQYGNITDVVVMYDPTTHRPRGFGFITFDSEDAVEQVLQQKTFHEIHDKLVEVKKAVPKEQSGGRTGGAGFGSGRAAPMTNGYVQGNNVGSGGGYGGPRFAPPPGPRGPYPPYGAPGYGAPGYGATPGFGIPMNGAYGNTPYGGGAAYPHGGPYGPAYGGAPAGAYGGGAGYGAPVAPSGGYVAVPPIGPRSPWGNSGTGFAGGASPGYAAGWNAGNGAPQANGNSAGYGYGLNEASQNPNMNVYPPRNMSNGQVAYNDPYASGGQYGDGSWKSGDSHSSPAGGPGYSTGMGNGTPVDSAGYGVAGRQSQRGPESRFRPYPATGERAA